MDGNTRVGSALVDASATDPIDWPAVDEIAQRLGPRTRGLVAVRNEVGLRCWLAYAVRSGENWPPQVAGLYRDLFDMVCLERDGAA